jgi:TetR/AcrR family transcriptional regulator, regulator of biofilm formation and stress response
VSTDRRQAILDATLQVIARHGVHAVTHRAVAAEGGVPLASTTYHFDSKDQLVTQTLALVIDRSVELAEQFAADPPADPAGLVDRLVAMSQAQLQDAGAPLAAQFELLIEAGRRPDLQPLAERWDRSYAACMARLVDAAGLPQDAATVLTPLLEGALLAQLALPRNDFGPALARLLGRVVVALVAPSGQAEAGP